MIYLTNQVNQVLPQICCKKAAKIIFCNECHKYFCKECIKDHEKANQSHTLSANSLCEECEKRNVVISCISCEQLLCQECDQQIHNKGKRATHQRCIYKQEQILEERVILFQFLKTMAFQKKNDFQQLNSNIIDQQNFQILEPESKSINLQNQQSLTVDNSKTLSSNSDNQNNSSFQEHEQYKDSPYSYKYHKTKMNFKANQPYWKLPIYQRFKNISLDNSLELSFLAQKLLYTECSNGNLSIEKNKFISDLTSSAAKAKSSLPKITNSILDQAEQAGLLYLTSNPFNENEISVSLCLTIISIQSLFWVLNSLRIDCLTPSEKLVQSRLKQHFGIKVQQKEWEKLISCIRHGKFYCNNEVNWKIKKSLADFEVECLQKFPMPKLAVKLVKDPLVKSDVHILYFLNQPWHCQDTEIVDKDSSQWKQFLEFMEEYFDKQEKENTLQGIQGGRYWCAQFVKVCGPSQLQKCSLGKLNLFVQEAINCGILKYLKTQIVRNEVQETMHKVGDNQKNLIQENKGTTAKEQKEFKIKLIQEALLQILKENSFGVVLSALPQFIKKRVPFFTNFQDLGFQKFKDFLNTMKDKVIIEMPNTNSSYAMLNMNSLQQNVIPQQKVAQNSVASTESLNSSNQKNNSIKYEENLSDGSQQYHSQSFENPSFYAQWHDQQQWEASEQCLLQWEQQSQMIRNNFYDVQQNRSIEFIPQQQQSFVNYQNQLYGAQEPIQNYEQNFNATYPFGQSNNNFKNLGEKQVQQQNLTQKLPESNQNCNSYANSLFFNFQGQQQASFAKNSKQFNKQNQNKDIDELAQQISSLLN